MMEWQWHSALGLLLLHCSNCSTLQGDLALLRELVRTVAHHSMQAMGQATPP
jgi:hypothetical protein